MPKPKGSAKNIPRTLLGSLKEDRDLETVHNLVNELATLEDDPRLGPEKKMPLFGDKWEKNVTKQIKPAAKKVQNLIEVGWKRDARFFLKTEIHDCLVTLYNCLTASESKIGHYKAALVSLAEKLRLDPIVKERNTSPPTLDDWVGKEGKRPPPKPSPSP